jgi:acyl-CoA dehydrogenase
MDFALSDRQRDLVERVREFVDDRLIPLEWRFFTESFSELEAEVEALREQVRELGLWAPQHPTQWGGMGLGLLDFALISEALGRSPLAHYVFGCNAPDAGNAEVLLEQGTAEQQERWLRPLIAGEHRSCFSMTEVDTAGSNPTLLETTAVRDGDDYVINGRKWYTTAADGAAFAVVMAVTNTEAEPRQRASMIIVPTDTPGFELVRNLSVMGHVGEGVFSHAEIHYRDCRVPISNRLGDEGRGFAIAQERLGPGRIHHCMRWLGICARSFDLLCSRAVSREIAPGKSLADRDIVRAWIAECRAEIEAARLTTLKTAWTIENQGFRAARRDISMIKFQVAGVMQRVVDRALQAHGGLGMTDETPLAFFFRQERAARIYDGPDEVHKLALARHILRDYR